MTDSFVRKAPCGCSEEWEKQSGCMSGYVYHLRVFPRCPAHMKYLNQLKFESLEDMEDMAEWMRGQNIGDGR